MRWILITLQLFKSYCCRWSCCLMAAAVLTRESSSAPVGGTVGISGYSNRAPSSHSKIGQHSGKDAVLFVRSLNLHLGLAFGNGPQSSTNSNRRPELSSAGTQVERPQNGVKSQVCFGSIVAHFVEAKHMPGKSAEKQFTFIHCTFLLIITSHYEKTEKTYNFGAMVKQEFSTHAHLPLTKKTP